MALKMPKNAVLVAILAEKTVIKGVFCKFGSCLCIFVNQKIKRLLMRKIFSTFALIVLGFGLVSCEEEKELEQVKGPPTHN